MKTFSPKRFAPHLLAAALLALGARSEASVSIASDPSLPAYGQSVGASLSSSDWPVYVPVTRYARSGTTFTIDYEYMVDGFGPSRPDFGFMDVPFGELVPGNYTLVARLFDINQPNAAPKTATSTFAVVPPSDWGIYTVPQNPLAFAPVDMVVRSAAYFNPATLRVSVSGSTVRVDFDYQADAPVGGATPPGMTSFAAVRVAGLAPGTYHAEGWGRPNTGGDAQRYFTRDFSVASYAPVVEYYAESLDHFFMSAGPDEIANLDSGAQPGWKRTGQRFNAWLRQGDAPSNAMPVCRFYAAGPNSHFYTADPSECQYLRSLEAKDRAASGGKAFLGWSFETIAFWALVPVNGQCPTGSAPVYRAYNHRAAEDDSNHRFMVDARIRAAMIWSWNDEGIVFCSPT